MQIDHQSSPPLLYLQLHLTVEPSHDAMIVIMRRKKTTKKIILTKIIANILPMHIAIIGDGTVKWCVNLIYNVGPFPNSFSFGGLVVI